MDNIIDLIATDAKPSEVSDAIKASLFAKAAERVDAARPIVAADLFDNVGYEEPEEGESEVDQESQEEE
jgi:hypothetical protein